VYVPAGTVHAILKGTLIAEIQQPSDITYRFFDWNRNNSDRPLHIENCLKSIKKTKLENLITKPYIFFKNNNCTITKLFKNKLFSINSILFKESILIRNTKKQFIILCNIGSDCLIKLLPNGKFINFPKGDTILIPAVAEGIGLFSNKPVKLLEIT
nr:hypothetical protein [Candidatus Dependentiae bacterium]